MSYLPPSEEVRASFESYFNEGLGLKEAISVHEAKLKILGVDDLTDATLNPRYDRVKYWLNNWRKTNLKLDRDQGDPDSEPTADIKDFKLKDSSKVVHECFDSIKYKDSSKEVFQKVVRLMEIQNDRFGASPELLLKVVRRLKAVDSADGWKSFLNSAGSNLLVQKRNRKSRSKASREEDFVDGELELMSDVDVSENRDLFVSNLSCDDLPNCILQI